MALNRLLVFTDFTAASDVAANHCYQVASLAKTEVLSLHVVSGNEDLEWAEQKSAEQMRRLANYESSVPFTPLASAQNLFLGMNAWLHKQGVGLAFMATHGKKDLQFLTGSHALKLILNADVPILVVQQHTRLRPYQHILLPVFSQQAGMRSDMAVLQVIIRLFGSRVTLLMPAASDNREQEELDKVVLRITGSLEGVASNIAVKSSAQPEKKFDKAVPYAAKDEDADLIAVLVGAKHHREEAEKMKRFYQAAITNEHGVPVLCL